MLHSMTGFGSALCKEENISVSVELKAVNNRYFKLSLRLSEGYAAFEQRIETLLRRVIERGTINAHIRITCTQESGSHQINPAVLQSYLTQFAEAMAALDKPTRRLYGSLWTRFTPDRFITLPGVLVTENEHTDEKNDKIWTLVEKTLREALDVLQTMRKAEGEAMAHNLTANVESLRQEIVHIAALAPRAAPIYRQKLKERIDQAMKAWALETQPEGVYPLPWGDADFVRELAVYADRCDISEELVRFQSHLEQFVSAMQSKESCGRKLDFLTQELFREVNTIGSKANDADITKHVVETKTIIERIREMVQNVE